MTSARPGAVTAIAIIGILLGILGTCGGLSSLTSLAVQEQLNAFSRELTLSTQGSGGFAEAQLAMQERIAEVTLAWRPALFGHQLLNLLSSLALALGCVLLLRTHSKALAIVIGAAIVGIVVDLGGGALTAMHQLEVGAILEESFAATAASDPLLADAERSVNAIAKASAQTGILFGVLWALAKAGFYVFTIVRLRKPDVKTLFQGTERP